ncbi:hypothetical protein SISSUDRAFT_1009146 [Sistotremastrum suecicum HHB10207 ss-3]|uniref:Acyltransferase MbtK/IucB-like conserved domain-containing protein n=1 Tax=Sistotremastrum suecicum HHB10207 ss-3 TaxID=1314776 RepID=A0A166A8Y6_9AGAM|nr:hypothetical protein SISSUDRAFT_1009146 [Sistotremastrum suecicum HHB10207 ss-3]
MSAPAVGRLNQVQQILDQSKPIDKLILPDSSVVKYHRSDDGTQLTRNDVVIGSYVALQRTAALVVSSMGTEFEPAPPIPSYPVIQISTPTSADLSVELVWVIVYALFTEKRSQDSIPINIAKIPNQSQVREYLLQSGLGRLHVKHPSEIFLSRSAFWQGAGTRSHSLGWLREYSWVVADFPVQDAFTRSTRVITSHPLRPPKPPPGALLYRRYCPSIGQTLSMRYISLDDLETFSRWHNDERVHAAWGERGTLEKHRKYIEDQMADPRVWAVIASWDDEPMAYFEFTWVKEDHVSQYIPGGGQAYDRGIHVLVGEDKFRGSARAQAWMRSLTHYVFIVEPRCNRLIGEPRADNGAIISVSLTAAMHIETYFDLPYKRSAMTCNLRERFFKLDLLH